MMAKIKRLFYKLILTCVIVALAALTVMEISGVSALALDQEVRCGLPEHTHTDSCYLDGVLLCKEKAHIHSENCYLLLLEDNDVNWLLQTMEENPDKSLEGVLDSAMGQALTLNQNVGGETSPMMLTTEDISDLNTTITENGIEPAVVLNENLMAGTTLSYSVSTLSVGDTPSTDRRAVNFYIRLDGSNTLINSDVLVDATTDYITYSNAVSNYTSVVITGLTTSNIGSSYYFRYNTNASTTNFNTNATYSNQQLRMGTSRNARYAMLSKKSGNSYSPVNFYTVTLDYTKADPNRGVEVFYVEADQTAQISLEEAYVWTNATGETVTKLPTTLTSATVLRAEPRIYTVDFEDADGNKVLGSYSAMPENGTVEFKLPNLAGTSKEGWYWIKKGSDGTQYYPSDGTALVSVTESTAFVAVPSTYTITWVDLSGQVTTQTIGYRQVETFGPLADGSFWVDSNGNRYQPGSMTAPVTQNLVFYAAARTVAVQYDVNFPWSGASSVDAVPTIYGTTSSSVNITAIGGKPLVFPDLTSRTARREINSGNKESLTYYFKGWTVEGTNILIAPDTTMTWAELETILQGNDWVVFAGVWEDVSRYTSVSFFVRFDSAAVDTNGNITSQPSENYTPEVFNTYLGGVDQTWTDAQIKGAYEIADTTSDNSYTADQNIRALYGERANGIWMYDFPSDDLVFSYLKEYLKNNPGKQLTYEGEPVNPDQLNHSYYAIRWYVFKLEGSSWHVDGKVYKKEGSITVDKLFGGDDTALQAEKDGFYILAENGELDANGNFIAYAPSHSKFKEYLLVVNQTGANALRAQYPYATILIFNTETGNAHNYEWVIESVELGEYWHIEEYPTEIPGYSCYAEYSIYDTDGEHSAIAEYGTRASVIGKTFALDEDPDQGLMVDFRNYYYPIETILIKKEDAQTGKPIGGAVFELWQDGTRLTFNFNEETGQYERDEGGKGAFTQIVTASDGYSVISTTGFSYDYGDVIVKEVLPPGGYDPAPDITIGRGEDGNVVIKDIAGKPPDEWDSVAKVPADDILVVKDHAAEFISVTVEKIWNTNTPADSVEVVLQANGQHAAAMFPGMTNAQVVLNGGNLWTNTWKNLPRYANGQIVQWSVKEIIIGGKPTLSDGVTFANWIVTYSPGVGTDYDDDGDVDNWKFTVTNTTRRLQLILTKVGTDGVVLPGAVFSLEPVEFVDGKWQTIAGESANVQTTAANGVLTFENLVADTYYRLVELQAADGYFVVLPAVVLRMDNDGNIQRMLDDGTQAQIYDPVIQITGPYNIRVVNIKMTTLPETGGVGSVLYIYSGLLLLTIAAAMLLNKQKRRKEAGNTS